MADYQGNRLIAMRKPWEVDSAKMIVSRHFYGCTVLIGGKNMEDDVIFARVSEKEVLGFATPDPSILTLNPKLNRLTASVSLRTHLKSIHKSFMDGGLVGGVVASETKLFRIDKANIKETTGIFVVGDSSKKFRDAIKVELTPDRFAEKAIQYLFSEKRAFYFDVIYIKENYGEPEVFKYPAERIAYIKERPIVASSKAMSSLSLPPLGRDKSTSNSNLTKPAVDKSHHATAKHLPSSHPVTDRSASSEETKQSPGKPPRRMTPIIRSKDEVCLFEEEGSIVEFVKRGRIEYPHVGKIQLLHHKRDKVYRIFVPNGPSGEPPLSVGLHKEDKLTCQRDERKDCIFIRGIYKKQGKPLILRFATDNLVLKFMKVMQDAFAQGDL